MFQPIKWVHKIFNIQPSDMETQQRCKGCYNYLTVAPGRPCPICNTVTKPSRRIVPRILHFIDDYANRPTNNNYYNYAFQRQPLQTPPYEAYYTPPAYGPAYYNSPSPPPPPPTSSSPTTYNGGYGDYPVYGNGNGYGHPEPQTWSPWMRNNYFQQSPEMHDHEKKKAVLCGVTYKGHRKSLAASINNVRSMHQLLLKLGFPNSSIRVLTEEETDPTRTPTRRNIITAMEWLTKGCRSGDSLVLYYAGHGSHVPDENGDENDGYDEALCPVDYRESGKILDDEINAAVVAPLPHGVLLHSIMDTCFSGTLLDLPFLCKIDRGGFYKWEYHHPSHASSHGGTRGGKAICISACDDHQNSADTSAFTGNAIGALTYSFIQAVQSARNLTYGDLLDNMRKVVREAQQKQGLNAPFASSTSQEPQLSCTTRFEIYSEPFML